MADPATYRPAPGSIPDAPGVYRFRDVHGRVIYVGKAKSLRSRLSSYFQDLSGLHPRTQTMVTTAAAVDWTVVRTEVEALQLEFTWIKEFDPRFNVKYRDDKSYPSLAVTLHEDYPRLQVMRGPKRKGVRYYGPYSHAWAIRETLDLLLRVFPARTCSSGVFTRAGQVGRPCLLGYIGKCSAPCVGRVTAEEHRAIVDDFCAFMDGDTARYVRRLEREMKAASDEQEYERAARLRDDIGALTKAMEKQRGRAGGRHRRRRVRPRRRSARSRCPGLPRPARSGARAARVTWSTGSRTSTTGDLVEHLLLQMYGAESGDAVPREVLVPALPDDSEVCRAWLTERRGSHVDLRVPQRGDKRALLETVARNAQQTLVLHKTRRASDLTTRSLALAELQEALGLGEAPLRIECFDVSNLQGTEVVASLVVFEDGLPRKCEYRRFAVRGVEGQDDVASMREVVGRRFRRYLEERETATDLEIDPLGDGADGAPTDDVRPGIDPDTGRPKKFSYAPNLLVVDGGAPQVAAARDALAALGIDDVAVCGLAKRLEEVWLPDTADPVILGRAERGALPPAAGARRGSPVRDHLPPAAAVEVHDRQCSGRRPGLGRDPAQSLARHFGSLKRLKAATIDEVGEVPGIGPRTAAAIVPALTEAAPAPAAVNVSTGEILE